MKIQCSSQRRRREEGKAFVFDHQHGCRDITCKPAINKSRYGLLGYASTAHVLVASFLMLSINLLSDFRGYKQDEESVVLCIHGFPTSNYDWSKVGGPLCLYEPVNAKSPLPPPPIFDWGLFLYSREFDPKWSLPSQALTFISKCWSALQAKGFCNFFCILHEEMRSKVIAPIFTDLLEHLRAFEKAH